jgi:hypothetical protein
MAKGLEKTTVAIDLVFLLKCDQGGDDERVSFTAAGEGTPSERRRPKKRIVWGKQCK